VVGPRTRWGENLGAPRVQPPLAVNSAPDLSRAVRVASTEIIPNPTFAFQGKP
jgi:hypothetical protein